MILILHEKPEDNARLYSDKWLEETISAVAQDLCAVHHTIVERRELGIDAGNVYEIPLPYHKFKSFEPISQWHEWLRTCKANYTRLLEYGLYCCYEYIYRFHPCEVVDIELPINSYRIPELVWGDKIKDIQHKHHDVMAWCADNVPDLSTKAEQKNCIECERNIIHCHGLAFYHTPCPLVMPDKFKTGNARQPDDKLLNAVMGHSVEIFGYDVIASYRAYYHHLLHKKKIKCPACDGSVHVELWCAGCNNSGFITQAPTFTRREKPQWMGYL
jgi:hypothetical protein